MTAFGDNTYGLSEKTGIPPPTINRIINGKHKNPSVDNLLKIAQAYGVNTSQLLGELPLEIDKVTGLRNPAQTITLEEYQRIANENNVDTDPVKIQLIKIIDKIPNGTLPNEIVGLVETTLHTERKNILKTETVFTFINHPEQEYKSITKPSIKKGKGHSN